ncbi:kinase-like protein [Gymnopus androsaceus JB14]|uniref:Kinase-like protein n=1 Tax=Gymnopus androsaceus JB14 TaxID=1447944 RepID=A0A6A4I1G6_9AGAR|nr:kinase-like protein [Gymnopus androsaceus JB14]
MFLVVPLLQTKGLYKERKFSGNTETGNSSDYIGEVVNVFAHHVFEETNCMLMLADIQGVVGLDRSITLFDPHLIVLPVTRGKWDQGSDAIKKFCKEHCCNKVCHQLKLKDLQKKPHKGPHHPWE